MLTKEQAEKLTAKVLSYSTFPECEVRLGSGEQASIRFALNGITTSGYNIEQSLLISSTKDGQTGTISITELDDASIRRAVKQSEQLALISPPNPERSSPLPAQKYLAAENYAESTAKARNDLMIPHLRSIIEGAKKNNLVAAGFFERSASVSALANKAGNFGYGRTTDANLSTTIRTPDGSSSGWASQPAVRIETIDGAAVGMTAIDKCLQWKGARRMEPGRYTVVLEPTAVGDLVQLLGFGGFQARAAEEGRSLLSKKGGGTLLGDKMFPEWVTLRSDPFNPLFSSLPWSGGGLPSGPLSWIEKGVVRNLFYDRYWAEKAGKAPTPFPGNLVLEGDNSKSLADLIASVERGFLVTRFWYIRTVNPQTVQLTGLTRDGLFLVEKGKVTAPVVNFRFNESPARLLQNAIAAGKPIRVRGGEGSGMLAPPLVVKDFPFTSVSDAV
jgi:predicted Zn-dependent protease